MKKERVLERKRKKISEKGESKRNGNLSTIKTHTHTHTITQ